MSIRKLIGVLTIAVLVGLRRRLALLGLLGFLVLLATVSRMQCRSVAPIKPVKDPASGPFMRKYGCPQCDCPDPRHCPDPDRPVGSGSP